MINETLPPDLSKTPLRAAVERTAFRHLFEGRLDSQNFLFLCLGIFAVIFLLGLLDTTFPLLMILIILLLPISIGTGMRRWHDLNQSGWWVLFFLIPYISFLVVVYLCFKNGDSTPNRYGAVPDPKRPFLEAILNRSL